MTEAATRSIPALGELETAVLEFLWSSGPCTAKMAHETLGVVRGISLNTVQSTLERLYRKDLLGREKTGHAYLYAAAVSRESLVASLIHDVIGRFGGDMPSSLAAFAEAASAFDEAALRALERELRQRRERSRDA